MKFENANELNIYINSNYKKINITGIDIENLEIFIDGEITKNKQYAFIKFSDEKAYMQYKNQNDIAGIDFLKVVSHQINLEEFYTLMDSKKIAYIEFIKIEEEIKTGELTYTDTTLGWAFDRANIGFAWERGYTGAGIKALIVDTGFHNIPGELEFVDVYGEDDLTGSHGTQVASCLGAKMNNTGLVGVAPDIELYGFAKRAGGSIHTLFPEFINYIIDNGIRIVNFSIVMISDTSQIINEAFEYLDSLGVLVFASQGNFGQNFGRTLYSRVPTIIGVGGILLDSNNNLEISTGSTGATNNVDCDYLFSYGTNILTPDGTVTSAQGTSFGTPAIAGMFALLMQEFPSATRKQLMDIMNYNGEKVDNYYGIFPKYGSHTEQLVEIYPPDWDSNLKVYPVTLSSGVIEKGNKLFVNQEEREYLEKVKGKDFVETIHHEDENTIRPLEVKNVLWVGDIIPINALSGDLLITSESLKIKQGEEWADLKPANAGVNNLNSVLTKMFSKTIAYWSSAFDYNIKFTEMDFTYIDTIGATSMSSMFYRSPILKLGLSKFNTLGVTNMENMFYQSFATEIDVSSFNTSNVTRMNNMFNGAKVRELNLSNFNTSKVTMMDGMFRNMVELTSLDISNFNTSLVTNMSHMFYECKKLTPLDVSSFNTSLVTNMYNMFSEMRELTSLDVSNFNTENVTNMSNMFSNMWKLTSLNVSNLNTSLITDMSNMFSNAYELISLDVSSFNTSLVTNMYNMFNGCMKLTSLDVSSFNTSNVTNMSYMFFDCGKLTVLDLSSFDTSNVTNTDYMFYGCSSVTTAYARTQADADRFNASSGKPAGLNFVVKP